MILTKRSDGAVDRWYVDGKELPSWADLAAILRLSKGELVSNLLSKATDAKPKGDLVAPIENTHEVWASGVTYLRSRVERESESTVADVYAKVYEADRPELFFKSLGWRVVGPDQSIRIRKDSSWNVPEPELTLVINRLGEIIGYTVGNDVSSRSIEGENPLYLPQAKTYDGSCAIGPAIVLTELSEIEQLSISLTISRGEEDVFQGETSISQMKRKLPELVEYLTREISFPEGVLLMTGTGIVPSFPFTLEPGDVVTIQIGELTLSNPVTS